MDRQNLIILIAAVIVVLGAIYYFGSMGDETVAPTTPATTGTTN
jgi:hypothetical protein